MVIRRTLTITDEERKQLQDYRDHSGHPQVRERCAAMLKIAEGKSPFWLSQEGLLKHHSPNTIYGWLDLYQQEGLKGLVERLHGGSRPHGF